MLTRTLGACLLFAMTTAWAALVPRAARADEDDDALRRPERLTVGIRDQFLGELSPDDSTLYFVSNRATRKEIFQQDVEHGRARRAFDEGAEVTWPRVSPDGRMLLYISFRDQATGQLCVRDLKDIEHRRCLDGAPAAQQAQWIDAHRAVLITRTSISGDLRVSEVTVGAELRARTLFDKNWSSPAVSPDGRWLVYVPLDRAAKRLGPGFAARAAPRLEAVRLDATSTPAPIEIDLPGMTAQPAFSRDGHFLYFVQFFSDSNHDGVIDATDHGVLFRIPFATEAVDAPSRAPREPPLQLTESGLNCQYPAPAGERLIATCSRRETLDVYELPLDGEVPESWTAERLKGEAELVTRHAERLLLSREILGHEQAVTARRLTLMRLILDHLELEEFDAAEFYAKKVAELREPATRGIGRPLQWLVEHRRARSSDERARTLDDSVTAAQKRLDGLRDDPKFSPAARVLRRVVASEIADWIGDKTRARRELEAAEVNDTTPSSVITLYHARADALYRELDDREALVAVYRRLASNLGLTAGERVDYARAGVRALVRGRAADEADRILAGERATEAGDSDFGFALDLGRLVVAIRSDRPGRDLRTRLLTLYDAQARPERRRALVFDAVERAADMGADFIIEGLIERHIDGLAPGTDERLRAMRVYRRTLLGRAYRRLSRGRLPEARADFEAIMRRTESFEALIESAELRIRAGESPEAIERALAPTAAPSGQAAEPPPQRLSKKATPAMAAPAMAAGPPSGHDPWSRSAGGDDEGPDALAHFVKAYLDARKLQHLAGEQHEIATTEARGHLRAAWPELRHKGPARALYGTLLHQDYLRTHAPEAAEEANTHYMVALELLQRNPRYQAIVLANLGLLHSQAGNYRIALGYFRQRERLPYADPDAELATRLGLARALLHVDRENDAAQMADRALALVDREASLLPYRIVALDRAALYHLAAGHFERALSLYDAEVPLLSDGNAVADRRNRLVVRMARAAAALGAKRPRQALDDLAEIEPSLEAPSAQEALASPYATPEETLRSYRAIAAGLRANANESLGRLNEAANALEQCRTLSAQRFAESEREEDVRALALVETRLAANATARNDLSAAAKWMSAAIDHADAILAHTGTAVDGDQLHVLRLGTQLEALRRVPIGGDIRRRTENAHRELARLRGAGYADHESWFETYLALTHGQAGPRPSKAAERSSGP